MGVTYEFLNCTCCAGWCFGQLCPGILAPATLTATRGAYSGSCTEFFPSSISLNFTTTSIYLSNGTGWEAVYTSPLDGMEYAVIIGCFFNAPISPNQWFMTFTECGTSVILNAGDPNYTCSPLAFTFFFDGTIYTAPCFCSPGVSVTYSVA